MNKKIIYSFLAAASLQLFCISTIAQTAKPGGAGLFDSDSVLKITLSGDIRDLMTDRTDNPNNPMQEIKMVSIALNKIICFHFPSAA